ncbi:hypothetical protein AKJ49_00195 [candidate division MSBL1 archaeon SCGC-AAA382A03]|uniref:Uncharacterized protein n=1 Tax=candidate division MSBL1 archaeon SCGC-AAA382A03 TaxID=1698278 RepID=A0A133VH23_9EURY|nr:hypothetical protein AKJ49_00195 [candidate division MSBL1 archaeon SCGC-AAA382A03]
MKPEEYVEQFSKILDLVSEEDWSQDVDKTRVSLTILQELAKDRRMRTMREEREKTKVEPATEKQKQYMDDLGIVYDENITKEKASKEIESALEENRK